MTAGSAPESLVQPAEAMIDVRGHRVRVPQAGQGEPLVFLHGSGDLGDWVPTLSLLARDFTVYRPDHPGFSFSDDDPAVDTVADLAFSYLDLFDCLGLDRLHLMGLSLGGWIAAQIAVLAPERISTLILIDAAGLPVDAPVPNMFTLDPAETASLLFHRADLRSVAMAAARNMVKHQPELFRRYQRNWMATARLGRIPYLHDPKLAGRLHRITCPSLVIWGALDRLFPVEQAYKWAAALGGARLAVLPECGHVPPAEMPLEFVALVREFLSGNGTA